MAFSPSASRKSPIAEINVTPLVDVMLVLLIIFMVTAPMMQEGVSVDLPQAKGAPLPQEQTAQEVVIAVTAEGKVLVNDAVTPEERLAERILALTKDRTNREVFMRADKNVAYGVVVRIMGALRNAGVSNLNMITSPQEEPAPRR